MRHCNKQATRQHSSYQLGLVEGKTLQEQARHEVKVTGTHEDTELEVVDCNTTACMSPSV